MDPMKDTQSKTVGKTAESSTTKHDFDDDHRNAPASQQFPSSPANLDPPSNGQSSLVVDTIEFATQGTQLCTPALRLVHHQPQVG